jgi:hypothetical protein
VSPSTWFEERGIADAVLEVVFDGDRKGQFPRGFVPWADWIPVPLMPVAPSPHPWDCRLILDGLQPVSGETYRLDGFFLSPETAPLALPVGARFTLVPGGRRLGHGTVIEWLGR